MEIARPADVRLLDCPFSPGQVLDAFAAEYAGSGGISSFCGLVRPGNGVEKLELTHYEPLTLPGMRQLAEEAHDRWSLDGLLAWHRIGSMTPREPIVLAVAAAHHRREAIVAVDFLMDHLKSAAWFWNRELRAGEWHWIEPRHQDHSDRDRWNAEKQSNN